MIERTETEQKLDKLSHALIGELEDLAATCKTTGDLKAIVGAVSLVDTFLARAIAVAIVSFSNGGTMPPPPGEPYPVQVKAGVALEKIPAPALAGHLKHLLYAQHVGSQAAAEAYSATAEAGTLTLHDMVEAELAEREAASDV